MGTGAPELDSWRRNQSCCTTKPSLSALGYTIQRSSRFCMHGFSIVSQGKRSTILTAKEAIQRRAWRSLSGALRSILSPWEDSAMKCEASVHDGVSAVWHWCIGAAKHGQAAAEHPQEIRCAPRAFLVCIGFISHVNTHWGNKRGEKMLVLLVDYYRLVHPSQWGLSLSRWSTWSQSCCETPKGWDFD